MGAVSTPSINTRQPLALQRTENNLPDPGSNPDNDKLVVKPMTSILSGLNNARPGAVAVE